MTEHLHERRDTHRGAAKWTLWGFLAVGAYFLVTEHRAHVIDFLPYLLLLGCLLLHLFGHGHHGGHGKDERGHGADGRKMGPNESTDRSKS